MARVTPRTTPDVVVVVATVVVVVVTTVLVMEFDGQAQRDNGRIITPVTIDSV